MQQVQTPHGNWQVILFKPDYNTARGVLTQIGLLQYSSQFSRLCRRIKKILKLALRAM